MNKKIFNYGFHDTEINGIEIFEDSIKFNFKKGIYSLNDLGNEEDKTIESDLIISVNTKYCLSVENAVDVIINRKRQKYDIASFAKKILTVPFRVHCIYYSSFNNTLLIEGDFEKFFTFIKIEHCKEFDLKELNYKK